MFESMPSHGHMHIVQVKMWENSFEQTLLVQWMTSSQFASDTNSLFYSLFTVKTLHTLNRHGFCKSHWFPYKSCRVFKFRGKFIYKKNKKKKKSACAKNAPVQSFVSICLLKYFLLDCSHTFLSVVLLLWNFKRSSCLVYGTLRV